MKKIFLITFWSILLFAGNANAQKYTLSGYIEDSETGEKLISANIFDFRSNSGTVTNTYGFYSLSLDADSLYIDVSYIGYETKTYAILLNKDINLNIELSSSVTLDEIEISAERSTRIEEQSQMSLVEVPVQQIKKIPSLLGEVDVLKALQLVPGVQSGGEGQNGLYVRGGSPDQNLILLDGVPVYNASHLFGFFSVFNADAIKNVTLIKGGFPARYGGRLSSIIDISMKDGNMKSYHGAASIGLISSKLLLEGPIVKDKGSFALSGRRTYIDFLAQPLIKKALENGEGRSGSFGYYFYDFNGKANWKFSDKDRLYLSVYSGQDPFSFEYNNSEKDILDNKLSTSLQWGNLTSALRWNHVWTPKLFSNTTLTYSEYNFSTGIGVSSIDYLQEATSKIGTSYGSGIDDYSLKIDFDYLPSPNHFIRFGAKSIYHTFKPGKTSLEFTVTNPQGSFNLDTILGQPDLNSIEYAAYLEDDMKIGDFLKLNLGLHYSHYQLENEYYQSLQPRISANFKLPGEIALKLSYATMQQYLQFLTSESVGLPWDQWLPTTELVKPQKSWQAAAGLAKTFNDEYELSVEAYYKELDNVTAFKEGAGQFDLKPWEELVTQGQGRSYGGELFLQKKRGRFTGWLGYTLSWTTRQFDEKNGGNWYPYKYDRRHDISVVASYQILKNLEVSATWVYGTGNAYSLANSKFYSYYNSELPYEPETILSGPLLSSESESFRNRNSFRMAPYHRLDIGVDWHINRERFKSTISVGAYNAYNRSNPFFLNATTKYVPEPNSDGSFNSITILEQFSLFPIIPSIAYRIEF
jgi:hypothetical protein